MNWINVRAGKSHTQTPEDAAEMSRLKGKQAELARLAPGLLTPEQKAGRELLDEALLDEMLGPAKQEYSANLNQAHPITPEDIKNIEDAPGRARKDAETYAGIPGHDYETMLKWYLRKAKGEWVVRGFVPTTNEDTEPLNEIWESAVAEHMK